MKINTLNNCTFGHVRISNMPKIRQDLQKCTSNFKRQFKQEKQFAKLAENATVVSGNNGKVFVIDNINNVVKEIKSFSKPIDNLFMALKTANMLERISKL